MKTRKLLVLVGVLCLFGLFVNSVQAQVATNVGWYILTTTYPDTIHPEFGTARDNRMIPVSMGDGPTTGTRVGDVTGFEVRDTFEVPDMCISTNAGLTLWRRIFNPTELEYITMTGLRMYGGPVVGIAYGGQMSLSGVSQRTLCDRIPLLNNQSAFTTSTYSVSRRGILKGPDGIFRTADDVVLMNGEVGTNMVDAVVLIGSRLGAIANSTNDIDVIDAAITPSGARVTYEYYFNNSMKGSKTVMLYPSGGIPNHTNRIAFFGMPNGMLFSVVGPPNSAPLTLKKSRKADGAFSLVTTTGTEGSSVFWPYTYNPTNDMGYVSMFDPAWTNPPPAAAIQSRSSMVRSIQSPTPIAEVDPTTIPWATDDLDQDR